jgi:hypothetical protein
MTARTGQLEQDSQNKTARKGQPERADGTELAVLYKKGRNGLSVRYY